MNHLISLYILTTKPLFTVVYANIIFMIGIQSASSIDVTAFISS